MHRSRAGAEDVADETGQLSATRRASPCSGCVVRRGRFEHALEFGDAALGASVPVPWASFSLPLGVSACAATRRCGEAVVSNRWHCSGSSGSVV